MLFSPVVVFGSVAWVALIEADREWLPRP